MDKCDYLCGKGAEWEVLSPEDDDYRFLVCTDHISTLIALKQHQTYGIYALED